MKAQDLMIGDIVAVNNTPLRIAALGTAKTGFIDAKGEMFYHYYDNIEPIPLTSEILEKNEFRNSLDEWHLFQGCLQTNFTLKSYDDTNEVLLPLFNGNMQIIYVHELQHALKLCGIDKNIEL